MKVTCISPILDDDTRIMYKTSRDTETYTASVTDLTERKIDREEVIIFLR